MKCPKCSAPTEVYQTRTTKAGYTRKRQCFNEHVFYTVETVTDEPRDKLPYFNQHTKRRNQNG